MKGPSGLGVLTLLYCCFALTPQVKTADVVTKKEQINRVIEENINCDRQILNQTEGDGSCSPEWDGITCWPKGIPGKLTAVHCPSYLLDFNHDGFAYRHCDDNGKWKLVESRNQTWSNYSECLIQTFNWQRQQEIFERMSVMYTFGYALSLSSLTVAFMIMGYFKRLHCTRNYIHMHLFASFMLRAISIFIKDHASFSHLGETDDSPSVDDVKAMTIVAATDKSYNVGCKIVVVLFIYFITTNYFWILAEGLYLHCLILMAFLSDRKYLWGFTFIGWGVPSIFVVSWAIVRAMVADIRCWDLNEENFKWIYQAPIVITIVINFFLFVNIVRILATKLRETNAGRYDAKKQYRKLARSTLILVLVFGVHYSVFVGLPHNFSGIAWEIRMHFELFFNSFQGFFVSLIYCFCAAEVSYSFALLVGGVTHSKIGLVIFFLGKNIHFPHSYFFKETIRIKKINKIADAGNLERKQKVVEVLNGPAESEEKRTMLTFPGLVQSLQITAFTLLSLAQALHDQLRVSSYFCQCQS
ncbi:parathyroid hormone 2 receptor-like [Hypanus sabinus]|uniref:parathyroid hormone 2 receptor-like n=1 Tax=Hypanus sabinus TaxID=79690 RepID=UPI0028C4FB22|nr:parathyroid hormone 2 receptor-like [Hypanus sabinus]